MEPKTYKNVDQVAEVAAEVFRAAFDTEGAVAKISGPSSVKSRYMTEDVPYGLVPIAKLARKFNVATPLIDSVIELASVTHQTNYHEEGISLEEQGRVSESIAGRILTIQRFL